MRMLFAALCLCSGAASATDCTMSLSSAQIDYGSLSRAELKTTLRPVSLGKRQLVLIVTCRQPQPFNLQRSEEHTSELQSLMRISYAVFCLKKKKISK